jgi:hypothetical protein
MILDLQKGAWPRYVSSMVPSAMSCLAVHGQVYGLIRPQHVMG